MLGFVGLLLGFSGFYWVLLGFIRCLGFNTFFSRFVSIIQMFPQISLRVFSLGVQGISLRSLFCFVVSSAKPFSSAVGDATLGFCKLVLQTSDDFFFGHF